MFDILVLFKLGVVSAVAREETRNIWFFSSEFITGEFKINLIEL